MGKSSDSSDNGGCFLVPVAAITVVVGAMAFLSGWTPEEALTLGLQAGFGLVCGLPVLLGSGLLLAFWIMRVLR